MFLPSQSWDIVKGFCHVKKNPKIREELGSGWVAQAQNRILIFFYFFFFFFCVVFMFLKVSKKNWIGWWVGGILTMDFLT